MAFDKNKPKILKLDQTFNTIAGLSQDLRDQAYKLDIVRSKQNLNKTISPFVMSLGVGGLFSYPFLLRNNLNPGLIHLISSMILFGIGMKLKLITSPFGNLIEKPLKFALVDLNDNNKILTKTDLLSIGVDLPDPIKFYDLGKSDLELKISAPQRPETKTGTSDFIKKETTDAGKPEEKNIYTWNNKKSSEYALIFDQESQQTINEIIRIYEKPNVKEHFQRYGLLYFTGAVTGLAPMVEKPVTKALQPAKQPAQSREIIPSNLSDITPMPKKKTPSRQQLIERLKK
jgi:hypothetical protein